MPWLVVANFPTNWEFTRLKCMRLMTLQSSSISTLDFNCSKIMRCTFTFRLTRLAFLEGRSNDEFHPLNHVLMDSRIAGRIGAGGVGCGGVLLVGVASIRVSAIVGNAGVVAAAARRGCGG